LARRLLVFLCVQASATFMSAWQTVYTISPSNDSTIALEIFKTGLMRGKKHMLFFENFAGELSFVREHPESSRLDISIDALSVTCRDQWLKPKQQLLVTKYAQNEALAAGRYPDIRFASTRISAKPLRGFVIEGVLTLRGTGRNVRVNVVLSDLKKGRFQIDGDATLRLSDFGIIPPSMLFGLVGTKDEALLRLLLWATEPVEAPV
jgi:polyisoprenoid-binding protein YceI